VLAERAGALARGALLLLVRFLDGDRMVRVVRLGDEVRDRHRDRRRGESAAFVVRREPVALAEPARDQRRLRDHDVGGAQHRWGERVGRQLPGERFRHDLVALLASDIDVGLRRVLEHEPHELAATLDSRPVEQLVHARRWCISRASRCGGCA
jgi:hypothetical protein